jgi:hypothetical protein
VKTAAHVSPHAEALAALSELQPRWDGDEAPMPSVEVIALAHGAVAMAESLGFTDLDIDANVIGGAGVNILGKRRTVWLGLMNSGDHSVVYSTPSSVQNEAFTPESWGRIAAFLRAAP